MTDKTSDDDRRAGDRRKGDDPDFGGPERRVGDRREKKDETPKG